MSKAFTILGFMVRDGHLDPEIIRIFIKSGLYLEYVNKNLDPQQIDGFDPDQWLEKYYPKDFQNTLPNFDDLTKYNSN